MAYTPAETERWTTIAMCGVGAFLFLLLTGVASLGLWHKMRLPETHVPATARINGVQILCEVQRRAAKKWRVDSVHSCEEARRIVAERSGGLTPWRAVEAEYVAISYEVAGAAHKKALRRSEVSLEPVNAGDERLLYVDSADPSRIERPLGDEDYATFWLLSGLGAGLGLLIAGLGRVLARLHRKKHERALAVGGTMNRDGTLSYPEKTRTGDAVAFEVAPWARILQWIGVAVLVAGLGLAVLAVLAGLSDGGKSGDGSTIYGAVIMAVLAVAIWRVCKMIAAFGITARTQ